MWYVYHMNFSEFILSYCKHLYKERCFFLFFPPSTVNSLGAADLRVEFDKIVITRAKRSSLDLSFSRGVGGGECAVNCIEQNRGEGLRQWCCSDIKGKRTSRFYLSFLNSAFKYWSEFGMKKSFRELGRRVECLYGPGQVWRAGLEVMHTKSYCAGIIYG